LNPSESLRPQSSGAGLRPLSRSRGPEGFRQTESCLSTPSRQAAVCCGAEVRKWPKAAPIRPPYMGPLTGERRPRMRAPWRWLARPSLSHSRRSGRPTFGRSAITCSSFIRSHHHNILRLPMPRGPPAAKRPAGEQPRPRRTALELRAPG
jgi:hypothetical protein